MRPTINPFQNLCRIFIKLSNLTLIIKKVIYLTKFLKTTLFINQFKRNSMRKILLSTLAIFSLAMNAQTNVYSYAFDTAFPATWVMTNQSTSASSTLLWSKASFTTANTATSGIFGSGVGAVPVGQAGGTNSFAIVNFNSTTSTGTTATISNWLLSPSIDVKDGDVVSFYTRKGTDGATDYPDRLEVRYSTAATTTNPSGPTGVGSFTTLGVSVNPTLAGGFVYPKTWTKYSFTISGVGATVVPVKFGFRYFVTSGGPNGNNSDIIGIDTLSIDRAVLAVSDVKNTAASIYPNPAKDVLNISSKENYKSVKIYNLVGQLVMEKAFDKAINVSSLEKGSYIINLTKQDNSADNIKFIKE